MRRFGNVRAALGIVLVLVMTVLAACGSGNGKPQPTGGNSAPKEEKKPLVIGLIADTTGPSALIGKQTVIGLQLAIDQVNKEGGLDGRTVKLEVEDDKTNPSAGVTAMQRLVNDKKVDVIFGPDTSSITLAAMGLAQKAGVVEFASSLSPKVTSSGNPWIFRLRPNDLVTAQLMAQYVMEELKLNKIAVLNTRGDYGEGGSDAFIQTLKDKYKAQPVIRETINIGDKDATPQLLRIQNAGAEAILWWGPIAEAAVFLKNRESVGFNGVVFGANALVLSNTIELVGKAAEGAISATNYMNTNPDPKTATFETLWREKNSDTPNDHAPLYYDAMMLLREAVKLGGGTTSEQIRDGMRKIKGYKGITSTFTFDANGDPGFSQLIVQIKNGKQVMLKALNY